MRKIRFLGTGTSTGVPTIGCTCEVCTSTDSRDNRLRTSVLYSDDDTRILLDCGPDFRQQVLNLPFKPLSAVLISHEHYDHVSGLDDLRSFSRFGNIPIYAEKYTADHLRERMPYCFIDASYPGVPKLTLNDVEDLTSFEVANTHVTPLRIMHGKLPILGYKVGDNFAYITDMLTMPDSEVEKLCDLKVLVVNALRLAPHNTHQSLSEALEFASRIKAEKTYFIHMSHDIGLHKEIEKTLPSGVEFAYDGLEVIF